MERDSVLMGELLDASTMLDRGEVSSVELVQWELDRIARLDPALGSFVEVAAVQAMEDGESSDRRRAVGACRGPLDGIPLGLKDSIDQKGMPTWGGMSDWFARVPRSDAEVSAQLRDAGAVLLGKQVMTEGAYADYHLPHRAPVNPWDARMWPGASSSGSAVAVAASLCFGALGTDAGASIRIPASVMGVTSLRPTWGRVSRSGVFEFAGSFDQVGPIARSAADCAAIFSAISHPGDQEIGTRLRIGVDEDLALSGLDDDTRRVMDDAREALESIGGEMLPVRFPDTARAVEDWSGIAAVEAARAHQTNYSADPDEYGAALADFIERGRAVDEAALAALTGRRRRFSAEVQRAFRDLDALLVPVLSSTTPTMREMATVTESMVAGMHRFTCPWPLSGNPSITLPGGLSRSNSPIGFQLVGPRFSDENLLRIGELFQAATDWHTRRPPLSAF